MTTTTPPPAGNGSRVKKLAIAAAVFAAIGIGYGVYYMTYGQFHEETDDAYVGANLVYVNAQVAGTVVGLGADDNQPVKTGQTLVRLDHADAAVALADAEARLGETVRQIRQQYLAVDEAKAVVAQRETELERVQHDLTRRKQLAGSEALSAEELAHADDAVHAARDALLVSKKQLSTARANVEGTTLRHQPSVLRARAAYTQAYLAAQRNDIDAPMDGFVARRTVQVGQHVTPGSALLAVVPLRGAWVDANLKEPQLRNVRIGQPATVSADIYGSKVEYHGKVVSISAGSGGAFSLLPPQNATGNWIKVVQRVPVRIALEPNELQAHPLRVGLSLDVAIDTHDRSGQVDTALPMPSTAFDTPVFETQLKTAENKADAIIAREAGHDE
jgi:membrane fusion protein (multidrug efflux system)